jgi:hypothetical protein
MATDEELKKHAKERHEMHTKRKTPGYKPLSENHQQVGLAAERAFADVFGGEVDTRLLPRGDKGHDFVLSDGRTVDVKGARRAHRLLVKAGKKKYADIFVLAHYDDDTETATLVGWTTKQVVISKQPRDSGFGVVNYEVKARELLPMEMLEMLHQA